MNAQKTEMYQLKNENIDLVSKKIGEFLNNISGDEKNSLRFRLMMEEVPLYYQKNFGEDCYFSFRCGKTFRNPFVTLEITGVSSNPFENSENTSEVLHSMLSNMGLAPSWRYKNGKNIITLIPQKKKKCSSMTQLVIAVVAAVVLGMLSLQLPQNVQNFLSGKLVEPLLDTFMGLLTAIAGPLVFLSVLWGIYGIGDAATFGRIGKRMIGRFLGMSIILLTAATCIILPFFP